MKLWVDDVREPPDDTWVWVNHPTIAIWFLKNHLITEMSLDHDLGIDVSGDIGDALTTRPIIMWLCEADIPWPVINVHSSNPVGVEWLEGMITRYAR